MTTPFSQLPITTTPHGRTLDFKDYMMNRYQTTTRCGLPLMVLFLWAYGLTSWVIADDAPPPTAEKQLTLQLDVLDVPLVIWQQQMKSADVVVRKGKLSGVACQSILLDAAAWETIKQKLDDQHEAVVFSRKAAAVAKNGSKSAIADLFAGFRSPKSQVETGLQVIGKSYQVTMSVDDRFRDEYLIAEGKTLLLYFEVESDPNDDGIPSIPVWAWTPSTDTLPLAAVEPEREWRNARFLKDTMGFQPNGASSPFASGRPLPNSSSPSDDLFAVDVPPATAPTTTVPVAYPMLTEVFPSRPVAEPPLPVESDDLFVPMEAIPRPAGEEHFRRVVMYVDAKSVKEIDKSLTYSVFISSQPEDHHDLSDATAAELRRRAYRVIPLNAKFVERLDVQPSPAVASVRFDVTTGSQYAKQVDGQHVRLVADKVIEQMLAAGLDPSPKYVDPANLPTITLQGLIFELNEADYQGYIANLPPGSMRAVDQSYFHRMVTPPEVDAIVKSLNASILSRPKIRTLLGQSTEISIGHQTAKGSDDRSTLSIAIRPTTQPSGDVSANLTMTYTEIQDGKESKRNQQVPAILKRGETTLVGGFIGGNKQRPRLMLALTTNDIDDLPVTGPKPQIPIDDQFEQVPKTGEPSRTFPPVSSPANRTSIVPPSEKEPTPELHIFEAKREIKVGEYLTADDFKVLPVTHLQQQPRNDGAHGLTPSFLSVAMLDRNIGRLVKQPLEKGELLMEDHLDPKICKVAFKLMPSDLSRIDFSKPVDVMIARTVIESCLTPDGVKQVRRLVANEVLKVDASLEGLPESISLNQWNNPIDISLITRSNPDDARKLRQANAHNAATQLIAAGSFPNAAGLDPFSPTRTDDQVFAPWPVPLTSTRPVAEPWDPNAKPAPAVQTIPNYVPTEGPHPDLIPSHTGTLPSRPLVESSGPNPPFPGPEKTNVRRSPGTSPPSTAPATGTGSDDAFASPDKTPTLRHPATTPNTSPYLPSDERLADPIYRTPQRRSDDLFKSTPSNPNLTIRSADDRSLGEVILPVLKLSEVDPKGPVTFHENESRVVELASKISLVTDFKSNILRVTAKSPTQIVVTGQAIGVSDLAVTDPLGNTHRITIVVERDVREIDLLIKRLYPTAHVEIIPVRESLILRGRVANQADIEQIEKLASEFAAKVHGQLEVTTSTDVTDVPFDKQGAVIDMNGRTKIEVNLATTSIGKSPKAGDLIDVLTSIPITTEQGEHLDNEVQIALSNVEVSSAHDPNPNTTHNRDVKVTFWLTDDQANLMRLQNHRIFWYVPHDPNAHRDRKQLTPESPQTILRSAVSPTAFDPFSQAPTPAPKSLPPLTLVNPRTEAPGDHTLQDDIRALHGDVRRLIEILEQRGVNPGRTTGEPMHESGQSREVHSPFGDTEIIRERLKASLLQQRQALIKSRDGAKKANIISDIDEINMTHQINEIDEKLLRLSESPSHRFQGASDSSRQAQREKLMAQQNQILSDRAHLRKLIEAGQVPKSHELKLTQSLVEIDEQLLALEDLDDPVERRMIETFMSTRQVLESQREQHQAERDNLRKKFGPNHPEFLANETELQRITELLRQVNQRISDLSSVPHTDAAPRLPRRTQSLPIPKEGTALLYFHADWCGPCGQMTPIVQTLQQEGLPVVLLNIESARQEAENFGVDRIPMVVKLEAGKPVERLLGVQSESRLRALIEGKEAPKPEPVLRGGLPPSMNPYSIARLYISQNNSLQKITAVAIASEQGRTIWLTGPVGGNGLYQDGPVDIWVLSAPLALAAKESGNMQQILESISGDTIDEAQAVAAQGHVLAVGQNNLTLIETRSGPQVPVVRLLPSLDDLAPGLPVAVLGEALPGRLSWVDTAMADVDAIRVMVKDRPEISQLELTTPCFNGHGTARNLEFAFDQQGRLIGRTYVPSVNSAYGNLISCQGPHSIRRFIQQMASTEPLLNQTLEQREVADSLTPTPRESDRPPRQPDVPPRPLIRFGNPPGLQKGSVAIVNYGQDINPQSDIALAIAADDQQVLWLTSPEAASQYVKARVLWHYEDETITTHKEVPLQAIAVSADPPFALMRMQIPKTTSSSGSQTQGRPEPVRLVVDSSNLPMNSQVAVPFISNSNASWADVVLLNPIALGTMAVPGNVKELFPQTGTGGMRFLLDRHGQLIGIANHTPTYNDHGRVDPGFLFPDNYDTTQPMQFQSNGKLIAALKHLATDEPLLAESVKAVVGPSPTPMETPALDSERQLDEVPHPSASQEPGEQGDPLPVKGATEGLRPQSNSPLPVNDDR